MCVIHARALALEQSSARADDRNDIDAVVVRGCAIHAPKTLFLPDCGDERLKILPVHLGRIAQRNCGRKDWIAPVRYYILNSEISRSYISTSIQHVFCKSPFEGQQLIEFNIECREIVRINDRAIDVDFLCLP